MTKLHLNPPKLANVPDKVGPGADAKVLHTFITKNSKDVPGKKISIASKKKKFTKMKTRRNLNSLPKNLVLDSFGIIALKKAPRTDESIEPIQALKTKANNPYSIVGTKPKEIVIIWAVIWVEHIVAIIPILFAILPANNCENPAIVAVAAKVWVKNAIEALNLNLK